MSSGTGRACRAGMTAYSAQFPPCGVDRHDPFSFDEAAEQARPDFVDDADSLEAGRRRQRGQDAIPAFDHEHVRRIHRD